MLIKHKDRVVNLKNVTEFRKLYSCGIEFWTAEEKICEFPFESEKERNDAFEKILNDHNWQRMICDLDRMEKKA